MKVIRRITYDYRGNPLEVKDFEATPCKYLGEQGHFVRPADEASKISYERPDIVKDSNKEKEFIQNCESTLAYARQFKKMIMK